MTQGAVKPPNIIIASRVYRPEPVAAAYRNATLASALADAGASVTVLTSRAPKVFGDGAGGLDPRVRVHRLPVLRDREGAVRGYLPYLSYDIPLFFRLLFTRKLDLVVAEPPPTTGAAVRLACCIRRLPYVYYAADILSDAAESIAPGVVVGAVRALERFAISGAKLVIAVTDGVVSRVNELGAKKVVLIRNGIDTSTFTLGGPRANLSQTAVYAGTVAEWLGTDIFIEALPAVLERIPSAQIVFLGQGTAMDGLKQRAKELGVADSVTFAGVVPPDEASRWLRSATVGLASIKPGKYAIAFPTKILASLGSGTPVLYAGPETNVGFVRENGLGAVVPFDVDAVADALIAALSHEPTAEDRHRFADYIQRNASSNATGNAGAKAVLSALGH